MRVRHKSRSKGPSNFKSEWSTPHCVISVKGVVVTLQEIDSDRKYVIHYDRLSNPFLSGNEFAPRELEANANPQENEQDPEEDFEPLVYPEKDLIRTRSGRTVKSTKTKDFKYNIMLPNNNVLSPSISSSLETASIYSLDFESPSGTPFIIPSTPSYLVNLLYSSYRKLCISPVLLPCDQVARIRREQRA